ncbi:hypothetical protein FRC0434_02165 [Corynebacterium diphtheriae]|nr:hypothetical protein FRC0435_02166 [Corynebacterium diphtheriae]CAB0932877.1 hypothetical protein FRC0434_02165 [Corynebacterium diphtheriae]
MNKRRKDILAYFDTKSMHSKTGRATKRGYFEAFFSKLHTKSLLNRPFDWIWCEVPSFSGVSGGGAHQRPPTPANPSQAMVVKNVLLRVVPRRQHPIQNQCTLKPEEPINSPDRFFAMRVLGEALPKRRAYLG